jgi:hypothetical protein
LKWQPGSFMPIGFEMTRAMFKDQARQQRQLIDEYEAGAFDQRIAIAMEYKLAVKLTVWADGFTTDITGRMQRVDPITHLLPVEVKSGEFERTIGVTIIE